MGRIERYHNSEAARALAPNISKFGTNAGVGNAAFEEIWEVAAAYNFLSTAATLYIGSSDALDIAVSITVEGLDANWVYQKVEVDLDGTDPKADQVAVVSSGGAETWIRINRAKVTSSTAAVGNIWIADEVPGTWAVTGLPGTLGNTVAFLPIADQITMQSVYSTGATEVGALAAWEVSNSTNQASEAKIQVRNFGEVFATRSSVFGLTSDTWRKVYQVYYTLPPKSDIRIIAKAAATTADFTGEFCIYTKL